jgi:hypothetical protein
MVDRFKMEKSLSKISLHQAALSNTWLDQRRSRALQRQDREEYLKNLVYKFSSISVSSYLDFLVTFFD